MVLDASAVLEVLPQTPLGIRFQNQWKYPLEFHAPHLMDVEVSQALRKYVLPMKLDPLRAKEALADYLDLPIIRYPHEPFLHRIWELHPNATSYDAAYLALAEALKLPLVTCDKKLAEAPGHRAKVRLLQTALPADPS